MPSCPRGERASCCREAVVTSRQLFPPLTTTTSEAVKKSKAQGDAGRNKYDDQRAGTVQSSPPEQSWAAPTLPQTTGTASFISEYIKYYILCVDLQHILTFSGYFMRFYTVLDCRYTFKFMWWIFNSTDFIDLMIYTYIKRQ